MAHTIICGHCKDLHESVAQVRECQEWEDEPNEVCCYSCDGLIGWNLEPHPSGEKWGCGGPGICRLDFPATF